MSSGQLRSRGVARVAAFVAVIGLVAVPAAHAVNIITGPVGYGADHYVGLSQAMTYTVTFANDFSGAWAPAQVVRIAVPLDPNLDRSSMRLGSMWFGSVPYIFTPGANNLQNYSTEATIAALGVKVRITAILKVGTPDPDTLKWTFESLDPITGQPVTDPQLGFLPVDDETHRGVGNVTYSVRPKVSIATGATVSAAAMITFDQNVTLNTTVVSNRVDASPPVSSMHPDVQVLPGDQVALSWDGTDVGTGVRSYSVYMSQDAGPFELVASDIGDTSVVLPVDSGHRYHFYTLAVDNAGNIENAKSTGDASVIVGTVGVSRPGMEGSLSFRFLPVSPNPSLSAVTVGLDLPARASVSLDILDVQGRRVAAPLREADLGAGSHSLRLTLPGLGAGHYVCRVRAGDRVATREMIRLR